jgi:CO/xanthine dehydrogenase Mo-binding subunit
MNVPALPPGLLDNPRLDQWVDLGVQGRVTIRTGKVEIGQGVLTALRQIAAEELDVAPDRIAMVSGITGHAPNEGYTSGSLSIQVGGVALRLACAEARQRLLKRAAELLGCAYDDLTVHDGVVLCCGEPTPHDYWSVAGDVDLAVPVTGGVPTKPADRYSIVGRAEPRTDLAAKIFGEPVFVHDMTLPGLWHARVIRQPCRGATIAAIDEVALRRAASGPFELLRHGDFLAVIAADEAVAEAVAEAA